MTYRKRHVQPTPSRGAGEAPADRCTGRAPHGTRPVLAFGYGQPSRGPRLPRLPTGQGHSRAGRTPGRRQPTGDRSAPQRGGHAGRRERRVLLEAGARRPRRGVGGRARRHRPPRCGSTTPSAPTSRPRQGRRRVRRARTTGPPLLPPPAAAAEPAMAARRRDRRPGVRSQRTDGHRRRQLAGTGVLCRRLRRLEPSRQPRPLHLPRPRRRALLPRLAPGRRHHGLDPAHRSRP